MAVQRRVKQVTQKSTRPKKVSTSPEAKKARAEARKDYRANKAQIAVQRKRREAKKTPKEKQFDKERAAVLRALS